MILTDHDIKEALKNGEHLTDDTYPSCGWIRIKPDPDDLQIGSCSVDLRLGQEFAVFRHSRVPYIDVRRTDPSTMMQMVRVAKDKPFILQAGEFVLATTLENVALADDILADLQGRSSIGRLGIIVHATASSIQPGWEGKIVLELGNNNVMPVALYPGMRICSLTFERLSKPVGVPYRLKPGRKYSGQTEPVASQIMRDPDLAIDKQDHQLCLPGLSQDDFGECDTEK